MLSLCPRPCPVCSGPVAVEWGAARPHGATGPNWVPLASACLDAQCALSFVIPGQRQHPIVRFDPSAGFDVEVSAHALHELTLDRESGTCDLTVTDDATFWAVLERYSRLSLDFNLGMGGPQEGPHVEEPTAQNP